MHCHDANQPTRSIAALHATHLRLACLIKGLQDSNQHRMFAFMIEDANANPPEYFSLVFLQDEIGQVLTDLRSDLREVAR